jgi:acetyltransferase-like isoleucine patch superfamily enzyme
MKYIIELMKNWGRFIRNESRTSESYIKWLRQKGVKIGENVLFRHPNHTIIDFTRPSLVEIGDNVDFNDNFTLLTHDYGTFVFQNMKDEYINSSGKVKIGNNIYFGRDVTVLKGVTIGDNCIIGLGSVVGRDVPANSVAVGNPCRVVCDINDYYEKRKRMSVDEAIEYGVSIIERFDREPEIKDFTEEWNLFLSEDDYASHLEVRPYIDTRLRNREFFFAKERPFESFAQFKKKVLQKYKEVNSK